MVKQTVVHPHCRTLLGKERHRVWKYTAWMSLRNGMSRGGGMGREEASFRRLLLDESVI